MVAANSPGARGGWSWGNTPEVGSILEDPRYQPSLREGLMLGVGKAHRQVCYAHYDFRNFARSHLGTTGRVG